MEEECTTCLTKKFNQIEKLYSKKGLSSGMRASLRSSSSILQAQIASFSSAMNYIQAADETVLSQQHPALDRSRRKNSLHSPIC
jgi:hypothetical protein